MSSLDLVCAYFIAAINGLSATVGSSSFTVIAQDPPLPTLDSVKLPNGYCLTGDASDEDMGDMGGEWLETRSYRVQVATSNFGEDEPNHREQVVRALLPVVKKALKDAARNINVLGVSEARVTGDSGPVIIGEYGGNYVGFQVTLSVKEMIDP
jgi:hypothetical protein